MAKKKCGHCGVGGCKASEVLSLPPAKKTVKEHVANVHGKVLLAHASFMDWRHKVNNKVLKKLGKKPMRKARVAKHS